MTFERGMAARPGNKLLRLLHPEAYRRVAPKLTPVSLSVKEVLYAPEQPIDRIYFPEDAVICQLSVMRNGATIETATVGFEGASWVSASIGAPSMPCATIVAIGGNAHALDISDLEHELRENEYFRDVLTQYSHALLINCMRLVGCTGLHSVPQRCARWILTTLDRVQADHFLITHELLAMLLGVQRPSISSVLEEFVRSGALTVRRGEVALGNRDQLLSVTCDCYDVIRHHYDQVGRGRVTHGRH
jgi:Crp-like helix-turn-helix domain